MDSTVDNTQSIVNALIAFVLVSFLAVVVTMASPPSIPSPSDVEYDE
jgi:hypothetical protein